MLKPIRKSLTAVLPVLLLTLVTAQGVAQLGGPPDFNGDGFSDLAVGVASEDTTAGADAGAVHVIYGSAVGLSALDDQLWTQDSPSVKDSAEAGDQFGAAVADGDFNGDGFSDLAIGAPFEDLGAILDAGVVHVLFGSALGLTSGQNQLWHQDIRRVPGTAQDGDRFGHAVASGDFNGDGIDDLVVGVIGDVVGAGAAALDNAGAVNVLYGTTLGLKSTGSQIFSQKGSEVEDIPEANDLFGWALASGDLNGDGFEDVIIGLPFEDTGKLNAGMVQMLPGSASGVTGVNSQFYLQGNRAVPDVDCPDPIIKESCQERLDMFGYAVSSGDYDADGFDDLAIGVPGENGAFEDTGQVHVLYGSASGPVRGGSQLWYQDKPDVEDQGEKGDSFGFALATADFDGDGFDDLAIGVPQEDLEGDSSAVIEAGIVQVFRGRPTGLLAPGQQLWSQDTPGIQEDAQAADQFGKTLSAADFNGDGRDDLVAGVPAEDVSTVSGDVTDAGALNVIYGQSTGLGEVGNQLWSQDSPDVEDDPEAGDMFGSALVNP